MCKLRGIAWLVDWTHVLPPDQLQGLHRDSLGSCLDSYRSGGGLWGLSIDAAAQVAAVRPDLLDLVIQMVPQIGSGILHLG
jgi:hypothetical protein